MAKDVPEGLLEEILEAIAIETIEREIYAAHDRARESYRLEKMTVDSMDEFKAVTADYYDHHLVSILKAKQKLGDANGVYARWAEELLDKIYARYGGKLAAYDSASTGEDGGLRGVLDAMAEGLKSKSKEGYINYVCEKYIKPLDADQKIQLCREYMEWAKEYLPRHLRGTSFAQFMMNANELFVRKHIEIQEAIGPLLR